MGRKSIEKQIDNILFSKEAFGTSRHEAKTQLREELGNDFRFGMSDDKIRGCVTFDTYRQYCQQYGTWLQEVKGVSKYHDIGKCEEYAKEYIKYRLEHDKISIWTAKAERSALGKLYGHTIVVEMPKRDKGEIIRSRGVKEHDKHFSEKKNRDLVNMARATGCRRSDLEHIKPTDFFVDRHGNMWVEICGSKGGRDRISPVLPQYRELVADFIKDKEPQKPCFEKVHGAFDVHSCRREYARGLYEAVRGNVDYKMQLLEKYPQRHEYRSVKGKDGVTRTMEVKGDTLTTRGENRQTYNRDDLYIVSQALGHNRLEIATSHYL